MCEEPGLLRQLELLRAAKLMRLALICQDMADGLMAVNDITGGGCYREGRGKRSATVDRAWGWWCGCVCVACVAGCQQRTAPTGLTCAVAASVCTQEAGVSLSDSVSLSHVAWLCRRWPVQRVQSSCGAQLRGPAVSGGQHIQVLGLMSRQQRPQHMMHKQRAGV